MTDPIGFSGVWEDGDEYRPSCVDGQCGTINCKSEPRSIQLSGERKAK